MAKRDPAIEPVSIVADVSSRQLGTLLKVSTALTASLEMEVVLQVAIDGAVDVLDLDTGAIYLLSDDMLFLGATTPPLPPQFPDDFRVAQLRDHPRISECLALCAPVDVADTSQAVLTDAERGVCESRGLKSLLFVPLVVDGAAVGAFIVGTTTQTRPFSTTDRDLCRTLSHQVSLAVANARLFETVLLAHADLARAYDATLRGWSTAMEMRDADTHGHAERVARLTERLASELGAPEAELEHIYRGALLHDIGKMTVPDAILLKPGPLDEAEWEVMRRHPEHARRMLQDIAFLRPAVDIPYCHHERWDGTGYPRGLSGEDIPLAARIFSVIDVFEALTSDRPYRRAWTRDDALAYIRDSAGSQFDPRVVDAFLRAVDVDEEGHTG